MTHPAIPAPFVYNATILTVHDGDTLTVRVDRGNRDYSEWDIRLLGCNAQELAALGGVNARDHLRELLPAGTRVVLQTVRPDKYGGRWLARVWYPTTGGPVDLAQHLIDTGWAAAWDGKGAKPVPAWPRPVG